MKPNEVISCFYLQGALCMRPGFFFVSRYCWMIFGRTNAHSFTRMKVGHGWTPIRKIVTFSWNWQPKNSGKSMTCKWKGASRCILAILIQEAVPNHFLVEIGNPPKPRNWDWYVSLHTAMNTGREATRPGALLMRGHLSAPSRAARQKVSTAEPWKVASPNWEPNTPTRSPRLTT